MISQDVTISSELGLHARPAVLLVKLSGSFDSTIKIHKDEVVVDGKSIMGILMLEAGSGTQLKIVCDGSDEKQALQAVIKLISGGFREE